ncbi:Hypothetical predicted protein, partial [Pelobates cultripes]
TEREDARLEDVMENNQLSRGIVYAQLNMSKMSPGTSHLQPNSNAGIVYASIKPVSNN